MGKDCLSPNSPTPPKEKRSWERSWRYHPLLDIELQARQEAVLTWNTCGVDSLSLLQAAVFHVQDAATRLQLLSRSALRPVQAQAQAPTSQNEQAPTVSPWGDVLTPVASSSLTHLRSKQEEYVKVSMNPKLFK